MNIKKYRASTTREALEKIKRDLGEDAFVLETKQVRSKGFLGFGSERQIEVSAAVPNFIVNPDTNDDGPSSASVNPGLSITEDTAAEPASLKAKTGNGLDDSRQSFAAASMQTKANDLLSPLPDALQRGEQVIAHGEVASNVQLVTLGTVS